MPRSQNGLSDDHIFRPGHFDVLSAPFDHRHRVAAFGSLLLRHDQRVGAGGDVLLVGRTYGRIRRVLNDRGEALQQATASMPVVVSGLSGMPDAGLVGDVLEAETAEVAVERAARRLRVVPGVDRERVGQVDVEQAVAVVVEQRDAGALRSYRSSLSAAESQLLGAERVSFKLQDVQVDVEGAAATARCRSAPATRWASPTRRSSTSRPPWCLDTSSSRVSRHSR